MLLTVICYDLLLYYINYYNNERIQEKTKWMPPTKFREASMCT
ncbi:IS3 family transposase [Dysosmobacter sp.]